MQEKFGDRLFRLRKESNLTMDELASAVKQIYPEAKITKSIISRYENNIHLPSSFTVVESIADTFGVTTDYLMCRTDDKYGEEIKYRQIPVLGTIACGVPIMAQEDILGYEYILPNDRCDFCLRAKGDSMINARIYDGDTVYLIQQPTVENGEIAAVLIDNEATLKRVYMIDGAIILRAENPNFKDIVISKKDKKEVCILGKAVFFKSEVK